MTVMCEHCQGHGQIGVLVCRRGRGCQPRLMDCAFCQGRGQRESLAVEQEARGRTLAAYRKQLGLVGREAARILRMEPSVYNDLEWGRSSTTIPQIEEAMVRLRMWSGHQRGGHNMRRV